MKYYLVHITYDHFSFYHDVLIREDPRLPGTIETRAGKINGRWELDPEWMPIHESMWDSIKLAMKSGVCKKELVNYESKELTEEEVAMILFQSENVLN